MPGPNGTATAVKGFYNGTPVVNPTDTLVVSETLFLELRMEGLVNSTFSTST